MTHKQVLFRSEIRIFALGSSKPFGARVAEILEIGLAEHEERLFEDGEHKFRPLECVRGADTYVIYSLFSEPASSVNDKLCQLLFFIGALRDNGAARITAVAPYLPYSRKDRRTKPRDPLTSRYVAQLFEAMHVDALATIDVHNVSAFENALRIPVAHLETRRLFSEHLKDRLEKEDLVVASPDPGGVKRAQLFRESLEGVVGRSVGFAFMEKRRSGGQVSGDIVAGDVDGATVLIFDDLISTGGTMVRAARALRKRGAQKVYAAAAHGLFVGDAKTVVEDPAIDRIFVTDTVPPFRLADDAIGRRVEIVSVAQLVAEAIRRLHHNESIIELVDGAT